MVGQLGQRLKSHARAWQLAGWLILPACVLPYVWARVADPPAADLLRVSAFMVPVSLAFLGAVACWRVAERGTPGRRMWFGVAAAAGFLLASEAYYATYQLTVSMAGPPAPSPFDALNLAAAVAFFGVMLTMTRLRVAATIGRAQMLAAGTVVLIVVYAAAYRWFTGPLAAASEHSAGQAALWAVYSTIGAMLLLGAGWGVSKHRGTPWVTWQVLVIASFAAFSAALLVWPTRFLGAAPAEATTADLLVSVAYMIAYHVFFMASVYYLTTGTARWVSRPQRTTRASNARTSVLVTAFALGSVALLALAAYVAPPGSFDRAFYFAALALTTVAAVLRTSLADIESLSLREQSSADPLTSVWNRATFMEALKEAVAKAETFGGDLTLAVADIDDFARFNVMHGREAGDQALVAIATALRDSSPEGASVARLGGDEFAVVLEGVTKSDAHAVLRRMLDSVGRASFGTEPITLSVGTASWPQDAPAASELLVAADGALYWAKYQGKHRIQEFNETVVRALDADERARGLAHKSRGDIVRALAAATDARDSATAYHSRQVAALAFLVAESLGLCTERVQDIQMAALLHDVGKVAVPDAVLRKRSRLSPGERAVLREHAELGARILDGTELAYMAPWVRAHHERWDGTGYPDGIAGPAIPLEARIVSACDLYDRMVSGTPERGPLSRAAAVQELDQSMARALDPDVAEVLIEVVSQDRAIGWSEAWLS